MELIARWLPLNNFVSFSHKDLSQSSFHTKYQREKETDIRTPGERERMVELEFIAIHEPIKSGRLSIGLVPTANLDMCSLFTWIYSRCATRFGSVDHITTFLSPVRDSIFQLSGRCGSSRNILSPFSWKGIKGVCHLTDTLSRVIF